MFEEFINLYSLSKTLCFKLKPTELTKINLEQNQDILFEDIFINDNMSVVTDAFDNIFKENIENSFKNYSFDVEALKEAYNNNFDNYKKIKANIINNIKENIEVFSAELFSKNTLKILSDYIDESIISKYNKSNISKFVSTRKNICKTIAERIISNFEIAVKNYNFQNTLNYNFSDEEKENFKKCLFFSQNDVDSYNEIISNVNQKMNENYQKGIFKNKIKFAKIERFILSDAEIKFKYIQFMNNEDVKNSFDLLFNTYSIFDIYSEMDDIFNHFNQNFDINNVLISNKALSLISLKMHKERCYLENLILDYAEKNIKKKSDKEKFLKNDYKISFLNEICNENICDYFHISFDKYKNTYIDFNDCDANDNQYLSIVLDFSNMIVEDFKLLKIFSKENEDENFQSIYNNLNEFYKSFNVIYNCTRNFATKKNDYLKKYKMFWGNCSLGNGWSISKESEYKSCIFMKDNNYYFGYLLDRNYKFDNANNINNAYKKMIYMQIGDIAKYIGGNIFTKTVKNHFESSNEDYVLNTNSCDNMNITKEIFNIYINKTYSSNKSDLVKYIDFCRNFLINNYKQRKYFSFSNLKNAEYYNSFEEFKEDCNTYDYSIDFVNISDECIERLQKENKLWLFQIYCADYSSHHKGNKNIHTLLFESIFSEENKSENFPVKLCGGFEIRYREAGITTNFKHEKGSILVNKYDKNGHRIPNDIYVRIQDFLNGRIDCLEKKEKSYLDGGLIITHTAKYDIIKDRRYNVPQFEIHLPVMINRTKKNDKFCKDMNDSINEYVKKNHCNIIGIDRGERNLLCASVINGKTGELIEKVNLDNVNGFNYNEMLTDIQDERDEARKSWNKIPNIKNAKKGYLAFAVRKVIELVNKYDAIISLENLNLGFVNNRKKIEKSIYQQFVNQLINKLSYMIVDKKKSVISGIKQLAFNSCEDYKHNGIIYFVNPSYTSKIDTNTGFADLFDFKKISNAEKRKAFFEKMNIYFENNLYKFEFDYKDFNTYNNCLDNKKFIVASFGNRIKKIKNQMGYWESKFVNLNDELNEILYDVDKNKIQEAILNNDKICAKVFEIFKLIVQLRNTNKENDYLISPVEYQGKYFDTRNEINNNPDMTASYNIAIKAMLGIYYNKFELKDYFEHFYSK